MPVIRKAVDRLTDLLRRDGKITYHAVIDARTAPLAVALLDKIVANDEDGDTFRNSLIPWRWAQRPPIAIYRGDVSTCRIDGPWQIVDRHQLPLGGLILSPGVTAHLNPFEAQGLHERMQQAIEQTILAWVREHDLHAFSRVPEKIDRKVADPAAKAMIAAWVAEQNEDTAVPDRSANANSPGDGEGTCCSGEPVGSLCEACRKGRDHA